MWYEGKLQNWQEPNEELVKFFEDNENGSRSLQGVDDPELVDAPAWDIVDDTYLPWIPVDIEIPHEDIFREANHLLYTSCFTMHRPNSAGWLSLAIHGISSVHTNCAEDYDLPEDYEYTDSDWTDIAKFCPKTVEWMNEVVKYDKFTRVRFMALLPGGWLGNHVDRHKTKGVGATNVAINNPDGCALVMKDWGTMPFEPGTAFKINTGYEHAVWNRSSEPRIHMIFDGDQSDYFVEAVRRGYRKQLDV